MTTTNDEINQIRELRKRNYSSAKIAKKLNIGLSTVKKYGKIENNEDLTCPHCGKVIFEGRYFKEKLIEKIKRECLR